MTGRLFTSESVTEGHPDKIADQISDSVLDEMLRQDKHSRVAVETLLTTGLVVVAGEVTTTGYVDVKKVVRDRILEIGYDSSREGLRRRVVRRHGRDRRPVRRHRAGRRHRPRVAHRLGGRDGQAGCRRPGADVRLRLRRHRRADAAADRDGAAPRRAAHRGAQGRDAPVPPPRRQDPGHHRVRRGQPPGPRGHRGPLLAARRGGRPRHPRGRRQEARHRPGARHASTCRPRATGCWSTRPAASSSAARWATPA